MWHQSDPERREWNREPLFQESIRPAKTHQQQMRSKQVRVWVGGRERKRRRRRRRKRKSDVLFWKGSRDADARQLTEKLLSKAARLCTFAILRALSFTQTTAAASHALFHRCFYYISMKILSRMWWLMNEAEMITWRRLLPAQVNKICLPISSTQPWTENYSTLFYWNKCRIPSPAAPYWREI